MSGPTSERAGDERRASRLESSYLQPSDWQRDGSRAYWILRYWVSGRVSDWGSCCLVSGAESTSSVRSVRGQNPRSANCLSRSYIFLFLFFVFNLFSVVFTTICQRSACVSFCYFFCSCCNCHWKRITATATAKCKCIALANKFVWPICVTRVRRPTKCISNWTCRPVAASAQSLVCLLSALCSLCTGYMP